MRTKTTIASLLAATMLVAAGTAQAETLRLLTWGSYAPEELVQKFEEEYPDIDVEVTFSNNEEMIAKLRATTCLVHGITCLRQHFTVRALDAIHCLRPQKDGLRARARLRRFEFDH